MSPGAYEFVSIDLPALLAGVLAALSCGLLGNYLVLRRMSLMGDAISHAVLPGLVIAFILTSSLAAVPMFLGAAGAGLATVVLVEVVRRLGRVESGAAMGVVFSVLFALGVLLIERATVVGSGVAVRDAHLDAECVLYGQLEVLYWFPPQEWGTLFTLSTLSELPRAVVTLAATLGLVMAFVIVFFKELRLSAFDPGLSTALGYRAGVMHYALMILVAIATVASFEAVGSILVIAMLICPAATARLLTDRLGTQVALSAVIAVAAATAGYFGAAHAPAWLPVERSLNAAGMMTVASGALLTGAILFSPSHGVIARRFRVLRLAISVASEDVLGLLYRAEESRPGLGIDPAVVRTVVGGRLVPALALRRAAQARELRRDGDRLHLTDIGRERARTVVRSHRLWESYLVSELGLRPDHVHDTAMRLEHLRRGDRPLEPPPGQRRTDPHDRPIPDPGRDPAPRD